MPQCIPPDAAAQLIKSCTFASRVAGDAFLMASNIVAKAPVGTAMSRPRTITLANNFGGLYL